MRNGLVQGLLEDSADRRPEKLALVCDGRRLTYGEIEGQANRLAHALQAHGIGRGDRVAIYLRNSVELVVSLFGVLKAGAVFVVLNPTTKHPRLAYILGNCQARALITSSSRTDLARQLLAELPDLRFAVVTPAGGSQPDVPALLRYDALLADAPASRPARKGIDLDLACLIYTSGSTGDPKGVMSDHSNVTFAVDSITTYLENVEDDVVIDFLPLSFDYGLYQLLMTFRVGGTLVLEEGFAYPAAILRRIEEERVTGFPGVPTLYSILLSMELSAFDLTSLRYMTNTAAALPPDHIRRLRQQFPLVRFYSMYGLTETKRTLYLPPSQLEIRPDSVGIAIPGTEAWLEDGEGRRLAPGEVGELVVRGRHVMRGYWGDAEATAARFRPGPIPGERVCHTGDLFRMDDEGYFYFVAREDDIIKSRGEKVSPKEVENVLYRLPGVLEAAVVGIADPILGEAIKAFLVVNGAGLTEADVMRHCRAHLDDFMVPRVIEFRDELPKTPSGKIRKAELR
jgi:amino acid adenylation domain-containing protein